MKDPFIDEYCELRPEYEYSSVKNAMLFAAQCHNGTNQKYDGHPYTIHIKMTYDFGCEFAYLLDEKDIEPALCACWTHDVIEDTRQSYNDVKKVLGYEVAEIVFALTNEKGRTRAERANEKYYSEIRKNTVATFVKLCDRLANCSYSVSHSQHMADVYALEMPHFRQVLYNDRFEAMFDELEHLCHNNHVI